jgi:hypothetical protein
MTYEVTDPKIDALKAENERLAGALAEALENGEFMRKEYNATIAANERLRAAFSGALDDAYAQGVAHAREAVSGHMDWNPSTVRRDLLLNIDTTCTGPAPSATTRLPLIDKYLALGIAPDRRSLYERIDALGVALHDAQIVFDDLKRSTLIPSVREETASLEAATHRFRATLRPAPETA